MNSLLTEREREDYYCEFNDAGLLKGDRLTRYQAYALARQWGWSSANDIRRAENQNPIPNGDIYVQPLNMAPAGSEPQREKGAD